MPDYDIILTEDELNQVCNALAAVPRGDPMNPNVLDIETFPTTDTPIMPKGKGKFEPPANDRFTVGVAGIGISWADDQGIYIPFNHTDGNNIRFNTIVDSNEIETYRRLLPYLTGWEWANHRERYDWGILKRRNVFVNYVYCSYVEAMLTGKYFDLLKGGKDSEGYSDAGLKSLVLREFGYKMGSLEDMARYSDGLHIERVPAETAAHYTCDDVNYARKLHRFLYPKIKDQFLWKVEMPISHLTEVMEENGIPFRPEPCAVQLQKLQEFVPLVREVIYSQVERQLGRRLVFDVGNPNVIRELLFATPPGMKRKLPVADCLNLPVQKKSRKTGAASTDAKSLDNMAKDFEIVHNILTYRKIEKADDSFLSTLPGYIHPSTGCIHSTFHQGGVPAGRYASSDPNAQNWSDEKHYIIKDTGGPGFNSVDHPGYTILVKSDDVEDPENVGSFGHRIVLTCNVRNCVEVDEDELLVAADYRQAEYWGELEVAKESGMLSLIAQGYDPHDATAALMYHVSITAVPKAFRKKAKTRNFAMMYGETDGGAAYKEGTTVEEQRKLRLIHESAIPRVMEHRNSIIAGGRNNGYIYTLFGRFVDLSQLYDHPDRNVQEKADRLSFNAFVQGSFTGDMPKIAMVRCMTQMRDDYPNYPDGTVHIPIIHNGHDALMFRLTPKVRGDVSTIDLPRFLGQLRAAMELHINGFQLPAMIDISVGQRYGDMLTIHSRTKSYEGQSAQEVINLIRKKAFVAATTPEAEIAPQAIRLNMQLPPNGEQAVQLKTLLTTNPGKNVVILSYLGANGLPENVTISKFPTSLGLRDGDRFNMIFPCHAVAENASEHLAYMADAMENL